MATTDRSTRRDYYLEVVAKWQGTHGFGYMHLRPPTVNGDVSIDTARPWWVDRTDSGMPVTVDLEPDEFAAVTVGDLFRVSLEAVTTVGEGRQTCTCRAPIDTAPADHGTACPVYRHRGTG